MDGDLDQICIFQIKWWARNRDANLLRFAMIEPIDPSPSEPSGATCRSTHRRLNG
jgi:hypothetical protein